MKNTKKAFTLVELIVVITILAILGTIAFISLQGYSKTARDSTRISDLSAMKSSLELFHLAAGKYPNTSEGFDILYSGSTVWTQGTFGEQTKNNVSRLDKIPKDPLTDKEYTYSLTKTKQEYELAGIMEGDDVTLVTKTNAAEQLAKALVVGNYNGVLFKSETLTACEVLSVPSIISADLETQTDLVTILSAKNLVFNGYNNLPSNYKGSKYKSNDGFDFESKKLVVYSDNDECKPLYAENPTARIELIKNLQTAYSGTLIENSDNIQSLVTIDIENIEAVNQLSTVFVNNNLGGKLATTNQTSITTINGECGTANKIYSYTDKNYAADIFCANGIPNPTTPNFPTEGSPVNWDCVGTGNPVGTTENCTAEITATPIDGECGIAENTPIITVPTTNLCTKGAQTSVTSNTADFTWSCQGINDGSNTESCSVLRQYTATFNPNLGGTPSPSTITKTYNTAIGTLPTVSRATYTFNGWFTAATGGTKITTGTLITSNVTYFAQWTLVNPITTCTLSAIKTATTKYPGCNTYDIIVCSGNGTGYSLAACDIGAATPTTIGTSYTFGAGVCATGYHIPTDLEWQAIQTAGGWINLGTYLNNPLMLNKHDASWGYYWSSTTNGTGYAFRIGNTSTSLYTHVNTNRTSSMRVRCIKN